MTAGSQVEAWIESYGREIHAYLWRLLGDLQDAEDCLQETFLRALRSRAGEIRSPRPWLFTIATNQARSMMRKRTRRAAHEVTLDDEVPALRSGDRPDDRLDAVRAAVARLPYKQREALILRRYQGMAYGEIGTILNCSPASARANVYQAVKKLRRMLPEERR